MHLHKSPNSSRSETVYVNHWEPVEESYQLDSCHAEGRIFSCIEYWPTLFYNMVYMSNTAFISASFFIFSLQPQIWPICLTGMTEFPTTVPSDHAIELHVLFVVTNSSPILFTLIFLTNITRSVRFHVTFLVRKVVWNLSVLLFNKITLKMVKNLVTERF